MRGNQGAEADQRFEAYVLARSAHLGGVAYLLTRDREDAADLLQTTWTKVYAAWARVERVEDVDGYVHRVLANAAVDRARARGRRVREVPLDPAVEPPRAAVDEPDGLAGVRSLLAEVSPQQRAVLVLRYALDLSEATTAELLGLSVGTVKSYASRALAALRRDTQQHLTVEETR